MKPENTDSGLDLNDGVSDLDEKEANTSSPPKADIEKVHPGEFIQQTIKERREQETEDAFYVANLKEVDAKCRKWISELPTIKPYYEVRCNNDPIVLNQLNQEGVGFACSSKCEMDQLLGLGVSPSSVFLTNACKLPSTIRHAAQVGVNTMMFDNKYELHKIKDNFPTAKLVLQIKPSDPVDMALLENHYGCSMGDVEEVLTEANELNLNVIGISFQVSGVQGEGHQYVVGMNRAREAMAVGAKLGFKFEIIDIGGGFAGESDSDKTFAEISSVLRDYVRVHFKKKQNIQLYAEVGVFLVNSAYKLVANIIGKRQKEIIHGTESTGNKDTIEKDRYLSNGTSDNESTTLTDDADTPSFIYYINDGLFGPTPPHIPQSAIELPELPEKTLSKVYPTSIWDQTATNGQSCTQPGVVLPELDVGDWVVFADCGTYTFVTVSNFTSPQKAELFYVSWEETPPDIPKQKKKTRRCVIL